MCKFQFVLSHKNGKIKNKIESPLEYNFLKLKTYKQNHELYLTKHNYDSPAIYEVTPFLRSKKVFWKLSVRYSAVKLTRNFIHTVQSPLEIPLEMPPGIFDMLLIASEMNDPITPPALKVSEKNCSQRVPKIILQSCGKYGVNAYE